MCGGIVSSIFGGGSEPEYVTPDPAVQVTDAGDVKGDTGNTNKKKKVTGKFDVNKTNTAPKGLNTVLSSVDATGKNKLG